MRGDPDLEGTLRRMRGTNWLISVWVLVGLMGVGLKLVESVMGKENLVTLPQTFLYRNSVSVVMFILLAGSLYYFARKPLGK